MRKIKIETSIMKMGADYVICVQNENGHIGSVVVANPYQKDGKVHATLSTINKLGHKDDAIAKIFAKELCEFFDATVTCICGIHLDNISLDEIEEVYQKALIEIETIKLNHK